MIFQHGTDSTDYGLAVQLMKRPSKKIQLSINGSLRRATDRYLLLSKGEPQIYGTQYEKMETSLGGLGKLIQPKYRMLKEKAYGVKRWQNNEKKWNKWTLKTLLMNPKNKALKAIACCLVLMGCLIQSSCASDDSNPRIPQNGEHQIWGNHYRNSEAIIT